MVGSFKTLRRNVVTKVDQSAIFAGFGGGRGWEEQEASDLLSKKGEGRKGSIESQQKFDFFSYDDTP